MDQYLAPTFSIGDLVRGMARRKLLVLSCLALGVVTGLIVLKAFAPSYLAEARLVIDNQATPYDAVNITRSESGREMVIDDRIVATEVSAIESQDLSLRVIKELGLAGRADFDPLVNGIGTIKQLLISYGFNDDPAQMTQEQRALQKLEKSVKVYPLPESNAIGIKVTAGDGKTAADIANAIADTYARATREVRSGTNDRAREWLGEQIAALQTKVVASDAAVEKFRAETGLFKGQIATLGTQELSELNSQISLAEAASTEAAAKANEIRVTLKNKGSVEGNSDVLNSPTIQSLRQQQILAERKITELSVTYLPNHPKMAAARQEQVAVNAQIRKEALKIVEGLQGQANIAAARAASLRKNLDAMKDREGDAAQEEVKLKELERDAKANRDQLEAMMARYADSNTRKNIDLQPGFTRIIQRASAPAIPFFPKAGPMMLLTTIAGLAVGMGIAFLLEIMAQAARINGFGTMVDASAGRTRRQTHAIGHKLPADLDIPVVAPDVRPQSANIQPSSRDALADAHVWPEAKTTRTADYSAVTPGVESSLSKQSKLLPTVASIPMLRSVSEAQSLLDDMEGSGAISEATTALCTCLIDLKSSNQSLACAIASIGAGAEVATSALAVARSLARQGVKTLLIDLEGHRPLITGLLHLPVAPGLAELVGGKADFTKAIQRDGTTGLQVIRHGQDASTTTQLLAQRMEAVTKTLIGIYDVVLIHVGEASPSTLALVKGCSAAFLYAPHERQRDAASASLTLKAHGLRSVQIVNVEQTFPAAA